jgi:hypothetical protein
MATTKKTSPVTKFIVFLILVVIIILAIAGGKVVYDTYFPSNQSKNVTTNIGNYTEQNITNIIPEQTNIWNFLIVLFIIVGVVLVLIIFFILLFRYLSNKKSRQHTRDECIKQAYEILTAQGYTIPFIPDKKNNPSPKQTFRHYGSDTEGNCGWHIIFCKDEADFLTPIRNIPKYKLACCLVDAVNLDVMDEQEDWDLDVLKKSLWEQRFGKNSVPNWAGKTEREPTMADLFESKKPTVSFNLGEQEEESEEE